MALNAQEQDTFNHFFRDLMDTVAKDREQQSSSTPTPEPVDTTTRWELVDDETGETVGTGYNPYEVWLNLIKASHGQLCDAHLLEAYSEAQEHFHLVSYEVEVHLQ